MNYTLFTTTDFVRDALFQKWVVSPDAASQAFWEDWLEQHPEKQAIVAEARKIILLLGFGEDTSANEAFIEVWNRIQAEKENLPSSQPIRRGGQDSLSRQCPGRRKRSGNRGTKDRDSG
jgi:transmembrane sensor